jgi:predicted transcriptional regulator
MMSPVKESVIRLIQALPDDCTVEDIQYHLYVREKVEAGLLAVDEGRVVSQAEAEQRINEWLQSLGPSRPC